MDRKTREVFPVRAGHASPLGAGRCVGEKALGRHVVVQESLVDSGPSAEDPDVGRTDASKGRAGDSARVRAQPDEENVSFAEPSLRTGHFPRGTVADYPQRALPDVFEAHSWIVAEVLGRHQLCDAGDAVAEGDNPGRAGLCRLLFGHPRLPVTSRCPGRGLGSPPGPGRTGRRGPVRRGRNRVPRSAGAGTPSPRRAPGGAGGSCPPC